MNSQDMLFDMNPRRQPLPKNGIVPPLDRYEGALVFAAIGDALGWPTEFLKPDQRYKPPFSLPVRDFVRWHKMVGGRWWGYTDEIGPGDYSDDTQLTLAVARSLSSHGEFDPNRFAYIELPLWLHYERGGGRSIKTAARNLLRRGSDWQNNFYRQSELDYRSSGANGAAMRNLPIALSSLGDERQLIRDSFLNSIITHGHPRAIMGAALFGQAIHYALKQRDGSATGMIEYLRGGIETMGQAVADERVIGDWVYTWDHRGNTRRGSFRALWGETRVEAHRYLGALQEYLGRPVHQYYKLIGALAPATKGSGLGTVCAALFLFLRQDETPEDRMYQAVNLLGSDTDTIASFLGAMLGARFGLSVIPHHLSDRIQDREYLLKTANQLYGIVVGRPSDQAMVDRSLGREEALLKILAWEIGLHEMFWDAIDIDGMVVHPTLGRGTITAKHVQRIGREGYIARLISIKFDCGQSCTFHARVERDERVSESLGRNVERILEHRLID